MCRVALSSGDTKRTVKLRHMRSSLASTAWLSGSELERSWVSIVVKNSEVLPHHRHAQG